MALGNLGELKLFSISAEPAFLLHRQPEAA